MRKMFDLQRFAEGGAAAGAGAAAPGNAADAGQQAGEAGGQNTVPAGNGRDAAAQTAQDTPDGAEAAPPPEDLRAEFEALIKGKYKAEYDSRVKATVERRLGKSKAAEAANAKMQAVMDVLAQRYGREGTDYDGIRQALDSDTALYEAEAAAKGMDVEQYMRFRKLERDSAQLQRMQEQQRQEQETRREFDKVLAQVDDVKAIYPGFDLNAELQNPNTVRLLRTGVPLRTVYEVNHHDEVLGGAMQYTAQKTAEKLAAGIAGQQARPQEAGGSHSSPARTAVDVAKLTREERQALIDRARHGERVTFGGP